jgi:hypothetical protein
MLAQDPNTGYLHEIPDTQVEGYGRVLYDGLGNPVGWNPFDIIKSVVSNIPVVGGLVSNLLPGSAPAAPQLMAQQVPVAPPGYPAAPGYPAPPMGPLGPYGQPLSNMISSGFPLRRYQHPVGWATSALPYTGTAPRRLYMRCSVWPGQAGLVPVQPGVWPQAQTAPGVTIGPVSMGTGRPRRHFRRRR